MRPFAGAVLRRRVLVPRSGWIHFANSFTPCDVTDGMILVTDELNTDELNTDEHRRLSVTMVFAPDHYTCWTCGHPLQRCEARRMGCQPHAFSPYTRVRRQNITPPLRGIRRQCACIICTPLRQVGYTSLVKRRRSLAERKGLDR